MLNNLHSAVTGSQLAETSGKSFVYALGLLGYDFGTEARRDSFQQLMPATVDHDGISVPANPYDVRYMVDYLGENLSEAKSLIWTLNMELTPIYAIEPAGSFAREVYEVLQQLLAGQVEGEDGDNDIQRVSMPGRLTGRTVKLFSGQVLPVIELSNTRGLYGWRVNSLVNAALEAVRSQKLHGLSSRVVAVYPRRQPVRYDSLRRVSHGSKWKESHDRAIRALLSSFLNRVYHELRNLGQTSPERAINFAATNAFQAASTFSEAVASGMELDSISVEKSSSCRIDSDCWDVKLKFFDPENNRRAKKVFRFTIDVSDIVPVTLGEVRSWSTPD